MQLVQKNKKTAVEALTDISFFFYLFTGFLFEHTIIERLGILSFLATVFLLFIEKRKVKFSNYFFFYILFIIYNYHNVMMGYSIQSDTSLDMIQTLGINFIVLFSVFNYLVFRGNILKSMAIYNRVSLFFTMTVFLISVPSLLRQRLGGSFSILGLNTSLNSNTIALIAAYAFLISLYCYLNISKRNNSIVLLWYAFIVLLSGSRKGVLAIFVGLIILIYLMYPKKRTRNIIIVTIGLFISYILIMYIPSLYHLVGYRIEAIINLILGTSYNEQSLVSRVSYIDLGWKLFLQKPWRGYGLDCFRHFPKAYNTYSHNNYIEILVSGGLIAFLLYYVPYIILIIKGFITRRKDKGIVNLIICIVIIILIMDYGLVSYFDRVALTIVMFGLAEVHLKLKKIRREEFMSTYEKY